MIDASLPPIDAATRAEMLARLNALDFPAYCQVVRKLLVLCGYTSIRPVGTGRRYKTSGQGGLDLLAFAHTDLATTLTAVQIKRSKESIPQRNVNELRGTSMLVGAEQGLIITTSQISPAARKAAAAVQILPIQLMDGDALVEALLERNLGASPAQRVETFWKSDSEFFNSLGKIHPTPSTSRTRTNRAEKERRRKGGV